MLCLRAALEFQPDQCVHEIGRVGQRAPFPFVDEAVEDPE
ncbi:Uncharacterised protein [Mycobacteroides abscessus subsp. massiliense]|nr:Uncharacterised protein [Mycobacteroides abscessus subsp. massiliense]